MSQMGGMGLVCGLDLSRGGGVGVTLPSCPVHQDFYSLPPPVLWDWVLWDWALLPPTPHELGLGPVVSVLAPWPCTCHNWIPRAQHCPLLDLHTGTGALGPVSLSPSPVHWDWVPHLALLPHHQISGPRVIPMVQMTQCCRPHLVRGLRLGNKTSLHNALFHMENLILFLIVFSPLF